MRSSLGYVEISYDKVFHEKLKEFTTALIKERRKFKPSIYRRRKGFFAKLFSLYDIDKAVKDYENNIFFYLLIYDSSQPPVLCYTDLSEGLFDLLSLFNACQEDDSIFISISLTRAYKTFKECIN